MDRILEDLMGLKTTRPDEVSCLLSELYVTINQGDTKTARKQVTSLRDLIGDDPELTKAMVLIKRQEILGK